ncbi:LIM domain protein [Sarcoptes scabiei]|nr:LIM domain protein [Sarcoptes scabiei]
MLISLGNYAFGYNEDHATGGTFRRETGSPGLAHGSYGLRTIDGRVRVVNYVADGHGFRANIQTNEPGVEDQDPASVLINKAAAIVAPYINKNIAHEPMAPIAIQQSAEHATIAKYDAAPALIEPIPSAHGYSEGLIADKYEPSPMLMNHEPSMISQAEPLISKYEPAGPIIDAAPIVSKPIESAPVLSTYTTKTYASPAPILTSDSVYPIASALYEQGKADYAPGPLSYAGDKSLNVMPHLKK